MIILDEHTAFQRVIDGLKMASDGARMLMHHQPEKARGWDLVAQHYDLLAQTAFKLSEERAVEQANERLKK